MFCLKNFFHYDFLQNALYFLILNKRHFFTKKKLLSKNFFFQKSKSDFIQKCRLKLNSEKNGFMFDLSACPKHLFIYMQHNRDFIY